MPPAGGTQEGEAPEYVRDEWTGPVSGILERRDSWVPVTVGVEFFADGQVRTGTVRFLGADGLYLVSPRVAGDLTGTVIVTYPVPVEGRISGLVLVCTVRGIDRISDGGLAGLDLEIRGIRKEPAPGLFRRYVRYLYVQMLSAEP
jgi:hypothetical protein